MATTHLSPSDTDPPGVQDAVQQNSASPSPEIAAGAGRQAAADADTPSSIPEPGGGTSDIKLQDSQGDVVRSLNVGSLAESGSTSVTSNLVLPPSQAGALTFVLHDIGGVTPGSQAEGGFQRAVALWQSFIGDAVTIRLDVGFSALGPNVLGSTSSNSKVVSYSTVRTALIADQTSSDDATAVASLSSGSSLSFFTNNSSGARVLDSNGSANNSYLDVNTANLKALGITTDANGQAVDTGAADGSITFSSNFNWDFDPSNGITAGAIDFVGVAFHEIGHALGFVSGVDAVDYYSGSGPGAPLDLNPYAIFSTLDLFRYSGSNTRDLSYSTNTYFSINGGATNLARFSTGDYQGDGNQASHWKDNLGIGIMDPTSVPSGQANVVTARDIQAMDVIGWNVVGSSTNGSVTISDASITEGDSGTRSLSFTVTRTGGTAAFNVNYATADGTATLPDGDYVAKSGTLQFASNVNTQTVQITLNGDTKFEANETFFINLSGATNSVSITDSQAIGTITNDDPNHAPSMAASSVLLNRGQVVSAASLFTSSDPDGQQLSYWFRDNTIGGGRFEYDGVAQAEGQTFGVSQAQLSHLTFRAGNSGSDSVTINAWDGVASSSVVTFNVNVAANIAPTVSASNVTAARNSVIAAASLFSANDANGDALSYWFRDDTPGGGRFEYDGVAQAEGQTFGVTQAQLSHLTFRLGNGGSDTIRINAWDGQASSNIAAISVGVPPNAAPTMAASNTTLSHGQVVSAASLFSAGDANGDELSYWFRDNTIGGGRFEYDGVAQAEGQTFGVSQSQLSHLTFRAGANGTDSISVNTWDGQASSSVATFNVDVAPNRAPTVATSSPTVNHGQVVSAASLVSVADADGDAVSYWFRDNTIGGGHFEFDGVAQAEGQTFGVSQSQLSHLTFRAGNSGSDNISFNAWDGQASSGVVSFAVNVAPNHAPTISASNLTASPGQTVSAASLFSAGDADGDALTYWFRDNTPGRGRFEYDGVAQAEGQTFGVTQAQLSHLAFHAASSSGSDSITVNVWDGQASSSVVTFQLFV